MKRIRPLLGKNKETVENRVRGAWIVAEQIRHKSQTKIDTDT